MFLKKIVLICIIYKNEWNEKYVYSDNVVELSFLVFDYFEVK